MSEIFVLPGTDDVVALRDYLNEPGIHRNLYRVALDGTEIWRPTPPGPAPDAWTEAYLEESAVVARSLTDVVVKFDVETGAELSRHVDLANHWSPPGLV